MYPAFEKLPGEKKVLILTICIDEFSKNGYENTSTDTITGRAGISKGILFHYFKSKKNLFLAVFEHCLKLLVEVTMEQIDKLATTDFFERIKAIILIKQSVAIQYFQETQLVLKTMSQPPVPVKSEIGTMVADYERTFGDPLSLHAVFKGELVSSLPLREGVSGESVFNLTIMMLTQISNKYMQLYTTNKDMPAHYESVAKEIDEYIEIIKYGVYR
ncbi:TetR/AcrR family transcriptional regulator [Paenibacillus sp. sptzw28]|uniref:TetR/AcrR family transcriptional regulator n=1 Tax=Paenibacillus sp. sptzw28 TaxID=715179 RepID=UPI001C6EBEDD|nr:TetR/AcrR family transcriptional regulator [Paenibacillus sp. sptzw28]QYR21182.1 TetR/AcrR family transcriptional regulator [Paenibacillus sp. sptzw28]